LVSGIWNPASGIRHPPSLKLAPPLTPSAKAFGVGRSFGGTRTVENSGIWNPEKNEIYLGNFSRKNNSS
jgi:hypothetical protein